VSLRDGWDAEQERIKREEEARERARILAIHERIAEIRSFASLAAQCRTAARVAELLVKLQAFDMEGFEEFSEEAATVHAATVSGVTFVHDEKVAEEVERARVKAQQEADAAALKQAQAEQAAAAAQLAADRAALEKERAELAAAKAAAAQAIEDAKPKAAPVDAYEQELQAFEAAVTPHPVSSTGVASEPIKADLPHTPKATRPTDMEIIEVLALHYRCHELRIVDWLLSMDLEAVGKELAAEFV
jgi:septal ring factor EnvC (AmiA/AmiB activator)